MGNFRWADLLRPSAAYRPFLLSKLGSIYTNLQREYFFFFFKDSHCLTNLEDNILTMFYCQSDFIKSQDNRRTEDNERYIKIERRTIKIEVQ